MKSKILIRQKKRFVKKILPLSFILLVLSLYGMPSAYSNPTFGSVQNLSNNSGDSTVPQVATSGSSVYVVWQDFTTFNNEILFTHSANGGSSFLGTVNLSNSNSVSSTTPVIAASGSYVYVVWLEGNNATFVKSSDGGVTFGSPSVLSVTPLTAATVPQIVASANDVYVTWRDDNEIYFDRSTDSGNTFLGAVNLSNNVGISSIPKIAASGTNVYVTWKDQTADPNGDILFVASNNNGSSFASQINLSSNASFSDKPAIASSGNNVYVAWQDNPTGNNDIFFVASTNSGSSFASQINLSNNTGSSTNPQIATVGSNVYVAWTDATPGNNDVFFNRSTNGGTSFVGATNLSSNSGVSTFQKIIATGSNVYLTWQDTTPDPNGDILFGQSTNSGASFDSAVNLSSDAGISNNSVLAFSGNNILACWQDRTLGNYEINFVVGVPTTISVTFDAAQYKLSNSATVTITDAAANTNPGLVDTISPVKISSTTDPTGLSLTLSENGTNTGIFKGIINFTTSSSAGNILKAAPGDTITANFSSQTATASIFPRIVTFGTGPPSSPITSEDRGQIGHVTVQDQNSNLDPNVSENIIVNVSSIADPTGIPLNLTETGPNTGIFGGNLDKLIFMGTNNLLPTSGTITITQQDDSANTNSSAIDTTTDQVNSTSDMSLNQINLTETGPNTGIFKGKLTLTTGSSVAGIAQKVTGGDIFSIIHSSLNVRVNGLITPNPNPTIGALLVTDPGNDTVTASYQGSSAALTVQNLYAGGGGSGGIVRPGLILDVLASLGGSGGSSYVPPNLGLNYLASIQGGLPDDIRQEVLNQDPFKPISPSTDTSFSFPFNLDGGGYILAGLTNTIVTKTEYTNTPVEVKLNIPASNLQHIALYTNLHGTASEIPQSDTYIIYEKGQQLQIADPHGYLGHVNFDLTKTGYNNVVKFDITFAKPMDKSNIDLRVWDDRESSSDTKILDAWQVEPQSSTASSQTATTATSIITPTQNTSPASEDTPDLMPAIKEWGGYSPNPISDSVLLSKMGIQGQHIPFWVMKTSKWIVDRQVSEQEFENMIKYLASTGTIK